MASREEVEDFLAHYASEYYDPVKAKAYYEKTKQLKGRKPALTKNQNAALSVAKDSIATKRKADSEALAKAQKAKVERMQKAARESVARIDLKLKAFFSQQALTPIPENASPRLRATLEKSNAVKRKKMSKASSEAKRKVVKELRSTMKATRDSYKKNRDAIKTKYDNASKTEESNIRAKVR